MQTLLCLCVKIRKIYTDGAVAESSETVKMQQQFARRAKCASRTCIFAVIADGKYDTFNKKIID